MIWLTKQRIWLLVAASLILLLPLISMQFTEEVDWGILDFTVGGFLLYSLSMLIDLILNKSPKSARAVLIAIVVLVFILLWAEMAIGLFGSPIAGD